MQLHSVNPSIKALAVIILIFCISFSYDPVTPFLLWLLILAVTFLFGEIELKRWLLFFLPFFILAFGYISTIAVFSHPPAEIETINLFKIGPITITDYGLSTGLALGLRVLCFTSLSLLFIMTTNPIHFILSLVQQCKMPPKLAYGILAGYRFFLLLHDELKIIRRAHHIRGVNRMEGLHGKLASKTKLIIPLLASAIRKAERTAIAMESKGFTGSRNRTYFHKFSVSVKDWVFLSVMVSLFFASLFISIWGIGYKLGE
ncbi:energy-coupling factor transporter transmembrane component T family protein [Lederbergia panacisoli]|uniref:energy-coupling factor transporter transmembrane component T family protein n=1 Tax=Lederbergia panacisoli TaxID=1255251 RepID=UPI00214BD9FD|nr:energy-coupling factor transporter transmembrane component T [Lederbergia panacisoli]MCR2822489.1 energy-coupling factor transporter transmembrane protein EcfT [Lederbergia panacisoli]